MKTERKKWTLEEKRAAVARMGKESVDDIGAAIGVDRSRLYKWRLQLATVDRAATSAARTPTVVATVDRKPKGYASAETKAEGGGRFNAGETAKVLAKEYGVTLETIYAWGKKAKKQPKPVKAASNGHAPEPAAASVNFCPHCGGDIRAVNMALQITRR